MRGCAPVPECQMIPDVPLNLLSIGEFLTENKEPIFFSALFLSVLGGVFVAWSDVIKKIFVFGFMVAIVFPTQDIHFFVDVHYLGVPSSRGLYITAADLFLVSLALGTLLEYGRRRPKLWFRGATPYLVYMGVAALSLTNMFSYPPSGFENPAYAYGVFELWNIIKGFLVLWVMVNFIKSGREMRMLLISFMLIIVIQVLAVLHQQYILHSYHRARGTVGHSNSLAMFVGMLMPVILVLMLSQKKGGVLPWILVVLFMGGMTIMIKTVARAGLMSMAISCTIALALLAFHVRRLHKVRLAVLILIMGLGGTFVLHRFWGPIMARFTTQSKEAEASSRSRMALLKIGWEIAQKNILIGNGINSFPIEVTIEPKYHKNRAEQHNLYLLTLCEVGIIGLLAFLAVVGRVFQMAWRLYRQNLSPPLKILSIGLACGMLHVLIQSFFEFIFRAMFISYMFWIVAAMIIACSYMLEVQVTRMHRARLALARRMAVMRRESPERLPQYAMSTDMTTRNLKG